MKIGDVSALKDMTVARGGVFRMTLYPADGITPKHKGETSRDKYFIVLGKAHADSKLLVASVLINSEINSNKFSLIAQYQYALFADKYPFLKGKDRYVNGADIFEFDAGRISKEAEYITMIEEEDVKEIVRIVNKAPTVKRYMLKRYGLAEE